MRRREFLGVLGSAAAAWPLAAPAQQPESVRRIGVLSGSAMDTPDLQARLAAFQQVLQQLGWTDGRNVLIDYRWGAGSADNTRKFAAELVAVAPDVILATGPTVEQLLQATRTVPIVFVITPDPVGSGFVDSLSRPGGNATGFMLFEYSLSAKWLELLKQIAPAVTRAAVLRDPATTSGVGQFAVIQSVAPSVGIEVSPVNVRDAGEVERAVKAFARSPNVGLIMTAGPLTGTHRDLVITLAAQHKLPAVYNNRSYVDAGGLISYGANLIDQYRQAAGYVDRILKGEKPADLPVQAPTKYELVDQPQDRQGARPRYATDAARPRRRGDRMKRREFITLLGGAAAWPFAARAQQRADAARRRAYAPDCGRSRKRRPASAAFQRGLQQLGWTVGFNVQIDTDGRQRCRRNPQTRGGIGRASTGPHPGHGGTRRWGRCFRRPAPCRSCL